MEEWNVTEKDVEELARKLREYADILEKKTRANEPVRCRIFANPEHTEFVDFTKIDNGGNLVVIYWN